MTQQPIQVPSSALSLEFPMSLGVFERYAEAQRAVDHLSDHDFPVQNCLIVGTDLRQVERVTGRLTWGKVIVGGVASGLWLGLFVGLLLSIFGTGGTLAILSSTMLFGAVFGAIWAAAGYAATRGRRDFTSISQVVATRYELLVEHKFAQQGRELLATLDGRGTGPTTVPTTGPTTGPATGSTSGTTPPAPGV